jgi:hypothetical protein
MQRFFLSIFLLAVASIRLVAQQTAPVTPFNPGLIANTGSQSTATATLTPGQMAGKIHVNANAGAATLTTPTATLLCRLFPFVTSQGNAAGTVNFSWDWYLVNNGTMTVTLAFGTGVTNVPTGTLTVAAASVKHFMVILTNCGATPAAQVISLGTSVF